MPHRLTRRRLLATGALAGAAVVLPSGGGVGAAVAASRKRPQSFSMDVPGSAFAGGRTTGVLRAPRRFDLLGVRGSGVRGAGLEVRARARGGSWSRWAPLDVARHGPDDRGPLAASEPVWVGGADEFQLRSRRPLGGVRAAFVAVPESTRSASTAGAATASARASQAAGAPPIIGRDVWEAGRCPPRTGASYGRVDMAFVHHTVSANDYTAQDSAGIVLSICKYHRDSNGWNDIGYNFLVDRFGQIFEGRAGGIDQAVIGAQAEGYNRFSTGVANLGTFSSVPQSPEAIDALGRLVGWKLAVHGTPVSGTVTVTSGGGRTNRYPSGTAVTFQRISGHRDGCSTECPGNALYGQLQAIRDRAARVSPAVARVARLSILAAEPVVAYGDDARFSGQLTGAEGNAVGGVRVNLQKRGSSGKFTTIARTTTRADGSFEVKAPWRATGVVRVTARPAAGASSVRSPAGLGEDDPRGHGDRRSEPDPGGPDDRGLGHGAAERFPAGPGGARRRRRSLRTGRRRPGEGPPVTLRRTPAAAPAWAVPPYGPHEQEGRGRRGPADLRPRGTRHREEPSARGAGRLHLGPGGRHAVVRGGDRSVVWRYPGVLSASF